MVHAFTHVLRSFNISLINSVLYTNKNQVVF